MYAWQEAGNIRFNRISSVMLRDHAVSIIGFRSNLSCASGEIEWEVSPGWMTALIRETTRLAVKRSRFEKAPSHRFIIPSPDDEVDDGSTTRPLDRRPMDRYISAATPKNHLLQI
jgi:hypothetical protein